VCKGLDLRFKRMVRAGNQGTITVCEEKKIENWYYTVDNSIISI
jgi:hypothetical protein